MPKPPSHRSEDTARYDELDPQEVGGQRALQAWAEFDVIVGRFSIASNTRPTLNPHGSRAGVQEKASGGDVSLGDNGVVIRANRTDRIPTHAELTLIEGSEQSTELRLQPTNSQLSTLMMFTLRTLVLSKGLAGVTRKS